MADIDSLKGSPITLEGMAADIAESHKNRVTKLKADAVAQAVIQVERQNPEPSFNEKVATWAIQNEKGIRAAIKNEGLYKGVNLTSAGLYWTADGIIRLLGKEHRAVLGNKTSSISHYMPAFLGLVSTRAEKKEDHHEAPIGFVCTPTPEARALYVQCFGETDQDKPGQSTVSIVGGLGL